MPNCPIFGAPVPPWDKGQKTLLTPLLTALMPVPLRGTKLRVNRGSTRRLFALWFAESC